MIIQILAGLQVSLFAASYRVVSPDGTIELEVYTKQGNLYYELSKDGEPLISKSGLGLETSLFGMSDFGEIRDFIESEGIDEYMPYWGITKQISEGYRQVTLSFIDGVAMEFRVYDRGVAWRYICDLNEGFVVKDETAEFKLGTESVVYFPEADGFSTPFEANLIESKEINLLSNNLIAALAEKPADSEDYSWVKPGKVVWDWYHKWNLQGVDFKAGINTATYKYMIDFASENNLQYINIDDGWCGLHDFRKINKNLDLEEVLAYAHRKDIGVFLWCTWQTLEKDLDANLEYFKALTIAGLKVDFFDRADQVVVDFVNHLAKECGEKQILLNLHVMTTKAQQMAMYVIFHGGVQMLADSPTLYENDKKALSYLSKVPVTWDETIPVEGKIGEYVIVARRSGEDWYLAGLNSGKGMEFSIKTDFLSGGEYKMELLSDGDTASELISTEQILKESSI
ncbi:MAG: glycoside hydrolase family 97 catalytic domain-containing protein, partial [Bacteroidales bacterium]|nr:glycoside hydrolase family 97 catalytic domain-containing protein [Bacteroidales bacterium]